MPATCADVPHQGVAFAEWGTLWLDPHYEDFTLHSANLLFACCSSGVSRGRHQWTGARRGGAGPLTRPQKVSRVHTSTLVGMSRLSCGFVRGARISPGFFAAPLQRATTGPRLAPHPRTSSGRSPAVSVPACMIVLMDGLVRTSGGWALPAPAPCVCGSTRHWIGWTFCRCSGARNGGHHTARCAVCDRLTARGCVGPDTEGPMDRYGCARW